MSWIRTLYSDPMSPPSLADWVLNADPDPSGHAVIDADVIDRLAVLLGCDPVETAVSVRSFIEVHHPVAAFEMRMGRWRVELVPAAARSVLAAVAITTAFQLMGAVEVPVVVLSMAAALLTKVERVEVDEDDLVIYARLRSWTEAGPMDLADLYAQLPRDARDELTLDRFAAVALRLHEAGLARWADDGIRLRESGRVRGLRLLARGPSDTAIAGQLRRDWAVAMRERQVFVIHGRDDELVGRMFELLSLIGLRPLEWEPLVEMAGDGPAPDLHGVIRNGLYEAQAIVALLTPDDLVQLHPDLRQPREDAHELAMGCQPRPNVLLELGAAIYNHRRQTVVVRVGSLRPIADLGGINYIDFDGSENARAKLVSRLKVAGCRVDDAGTEWRRASRFADLGAYRRSAPPPAIGA